MGLSFNPGKSSDAIAARMAQQAAANELENEKRTERRNSDAARNQAAKSGSSNQKAAPPPVEGNPYETAIVKTMALGIKAAATFTDLLYKEGQEASNKETANLTPKQKQAYEVAKNASPQAVRKGLDTAAANQIAKKVFDKFKDNENLDKDAIEVAALLIEDSMGSSIT